MTWREKLEAGRRGTMTQPALSDLAEHWRSCAVGEYRDRLEELGYKFGQDSGPEHPGLHRMGREFYEAVSHGRWEAADAILDEIDACVYAATTRHNDNEEEES